MGVVSVIYQVAKVLAITSLSIEIAVSAISIFFILVSDNDAETPAINEIFSAGVKVRNSALCFLILLFFISDKSTEVKGMSALAAISDVCQLYALGALALIAIGVIISVILTMKEDSTEAQAAFGRRVWRVGMISSLLGFCAAYFFYIP